MPSFATSHRANVRENDNARRTGNAFALGSAGGMCCDARLSRYEAEAAGGPPAGTYRTPGMCIAWETAIIVGNVDWWIGSSSVIVLCGLSEFHAHAPFLPGEARKERGDHEVLRKQSSLLTRVACLHNLKSSLAVFSELQGNANDIKCSTKPRSSVPCLRQHQR